MAVTLTPINPGCTNWGGTVNGYWDFITNVFKGSQFIDALSVISSIGIGTTTPLSIFHGLVNTGGGSGVSIIARLENANFNTGVSAIGFAVLAGETGAKAGIGLERQGGNGVGKLSFYNKSSGTTDFGKSDERMYIASDGGLVIGSPSGGSKSAGTINAANGVYDNGTRLTCYVLEAAFAGEINLPAWDKLSEINLIDIKDGVKHITTIQREHTPARRFAERLELLSADKFFDFLKMNKHLPAMPSKEEWISQDGYSLGTLVQGLWETVEVYAIHIQSLNERIGRLEVRSREI